jgi:hypothetical protein
LHSRPCTKGIRDVLPFSRVHEWISYALRFPLHFRSITPACTFKASCYIALLALLSNEMLALQDGSGSGVRGALLFTRIGGLEQPPHTPHHTVSLFLAQVFPITKATKSLDSLSKHTSVDSRFVRDQLSQIASSIFHALASLLLLFRLRACTWPSLT